MEVYVQQLSTIAQYKIAVLSLMWKLLMVVMIDAFEGQELGLDHTMCIS